MDELELLELLSVGGICLEAELPTLMAALEALQVALVLYQSLEAHLLYRTLLASLCLMLEAPSSEATAVRLEPWMDHSDVEHHGHLEELV